MSASVGVTHLIAITFHYRHCSHQVRVNNATNLTKSQTEQMKKIKGTFFLSSVPLKRDFLLFQVSISITPSSLLFHTLTSDLLPFFVF